MGWDGCREWRSKEDVAMATKELAPGYTHLAERVWRREAGQSDRGRGPAQWVLWGVIRTPEGEGLVTCMLVSKQGGVWGYKSMDETVGPYYHSCPRAFLDLAQPAPDSQYSRDWRARVLAAQSKGA